MYIDDYSDKKNMNKLKEFKKLNAWWIAKLYNNNFLLNSLYNEIVFIAENKITQKKCNNPIWKELKNLNSKLISNDNLTQETKGDIVTIHGKSLFYLNRDKEHIDKQNIQVRIYRGKKSAEWWSYYLDGSEYSKNTINKFLSALENGGSAKLLNSIAVL